MHVLLSALQMDLQRPDWGGAWSDKSLVALQEVSVMFVTAESPPSPVGGKSNNKDSCWVTGFVGTGCLDVSRVRTSSIKKEMCYNALFFCF